MTKNALLRRNLLKAGACALAGTSVLLRAANAFALNKGTSVEASAGQKESDVRKEEILQAYFSAWEKKQWSRMDGLLSDDFTFTSPNNDDHISKRAFKERCWPTAEWVLKFEPECLVTHGDEGFAKYLLKTTDGKSFRNVEFYRFSDGKIKVIEVYFGGKLGYAGQKAPLQ